MGSGRKTPTGQSAAAGHWLLALSVAAVGCAGSATDSNHPGALDGPTRRDTTIVHEPCAIDEAGAAKKDANADGKPDVIVVSEGGKPVCQWLDLNFDQTVDVWVYFGSDGRVRRRETDFDRDGRVDEITTLSGGKVVSRERATTMAGRLDTWQYFENGAIHHAERDANGDGIVDQWWEYTTAEKPDCAMVHSDTDGDGRPDPGATVNLCGNEVASSKTDAADEVSEAPPLDDQPITETTEPAERANSEAAAPDDGSRPAAPPQKEKP